MSVSLLQRTLFLSIIVLPVLILIYPRTFNLEPTLMRVQSALFSFPLLAGLISFYRIDRSGSAPLATAQALLAMGLLYIQLFPPPETHRENREKAFCVLSLILLLFAFKPGLLDFRPWIIFIPIAVADVCLLTLLFLNRDPDNKSQHFTRFLILLALAQATLWGSFPWLQFAGILLHACAYISFFIYCRQQSLNHLQARILEAEGILSDWERSIKKEVNKRMFEVERSNSRLLDLAKTDPMTQIYNKVNILSIITALTEDRRHRNFSILMFDIDKFKNINDTRGHLAGDMVIKQVAGIASNCVRNIDSVGRYGGDEFIIVLPNALTNDARFVAERLRKRVEENQDINCTISIGIASFPDDGKNTRDLIKATDEGLYVSKQKGRNSVSHRNDSI